MGGHAQEGNTSQGPSALLSEGTDSFWALALGLEMVCTGLAESDLICCLAELFPVLSDGRTSPKWEEEGKSFL